jgi:osmoprotectant transport system ATP-binding protein
VNAVSSDTDQRVSVVELRSIDKSFQGEVKAVDNVSLVAHEGETLALLGPSGCGKTTTLRLINRLNEADSGEVLVRGRPVTEQRPEVVRRSIGYVIQEGGLFPHLSVAENVATVPRLLRWPAKRIKGRTEEVLDLVGLPPEDFARRKPSELSGGQRQRVGVARALASDPDLLLMDEPFSALDPVTRESLHEEFLKLQARLKKTVVIVTHDMIEAGKLADRIVLMEHGRVSQQGRTRELLFHPANEFVRGFFERHRQQMVFETLRLDELLEDLQPTQAAGASRSVELPGDAVLRDILDPIVRSDRGAVIVLSSGLHKGESFDLDRVRQLLFEELVT